MGKPRDGRCLLVALLHCLNAPARSTQEGILPLEHLLFISPGVSTCLAESFPHCNSKLGVGLSRAGLSTPVLHMSPQVTGQISHTLHWELDFPLPFIP